jgi:hypothetical protein
MFHHYEDHVFKNIIDEFIISSTNDNRLSFVIKNIDLQAVKLGISFYQMMFMLIQKDSIQNRRKNKLK